MENNIFPFPLQIGCINQVLTKMISDNLFFYLHLASHCTYWWSQIYFHGSLLQTHYDLYEFCFQFLPCSTWLLSLRQYMISNLFFPFFLIAWGLPSLAMMMIQLIFCYVRLFIFIPISCSFINGNSISGLLSPLFLTVFKALPPNFLITRVEAGII